MKNILVAVLGCQFKDYSLKECLSSIKEAGFENVLLNYEGICPDNLEYDYLQEWMVSGVGFKDEREGDQDQSYRLSRICVARNMCLEFAQSGNYDWILFVDSDVIIPIDTQEKLFTEPEFGKIRSGIVGGRGPHSHARYLFYPKEIIGNWQRADYFTCGFMAIHKDIFWKIRFRWGIPIQGGDICSEDPLFGSDARTILNECWWGRLDLVAKHLGDFDIKEAAKF